MDVFVLAAHFLQSANSGWITRLLAGGGGAGGWGVF